MPAPFVIAMAASSTNSCWISLYCAGNGFVMGILSGFVTSYFNFNQKNTVPPLEKKETAFYDT